MSMKTHGFHFFRPGQELVELLIIDTDTGMHESWYNPTAEDVRQVCESYRLDFEKTINIIREKNPDAHTMVIDVVIYRKGGDEGKDSD